MNTIQNTNTERKLAFDTITIEITRRCNLKCAHCMRGDAQEIDMSEETIRTLLNKTDSIRHLIFTGGEPTLNIDGMRLFLEMMIENNITLSKLEIVTNGVLLSEDFVALLKDYYKWIVKRKSDSAKYICLRISKDKYHVGVDVDRAIKFYENRLRGFERIKIGSWEIAEYEIVFCGRAKNLPLDNTFMKTAYQFYNSLGISNEHKIEILSENERSYCKFRQFKKVKQGVDLILCEVYVTAKGDIISPSIPSDYNEKDTTKNRISNVNNDIIADIHLYNIDRPYCIECADVIDTYRAFEIVAKRYNSAIANFKNPFLNPIKEQIKMNELLTYADLKEEYFNRFKKYKISHMNDEHDSTYERYNVTEDEVKTIEEEIKDELYEKRKKEIINDYFEYENREPTEEEIQKAITQLYCTFIKKLRINQSE